MTREFCIIILLGIVAFLGGCASNSQVVIPPEKVEVYTVELEFKLVQVDRSAPTEEPAPSEAPITEAEEAQPAIEPVEPPVDEPGEKLEPGEMPNPDETEDKPWSAPSEEKTPPAPEPLPEPKPIMPAPFRLAPNEKMIYAVQQTLTVGGKIDIKRVEIVKYMEIISEVPVEVEGNKMFSIEGKTKKIPGKADFELSVLVTHKDDKLKLNFSCETSIVVSALENNQQVIATVDDLKLVLICRKISKIEYEK